MAVFDRDYMRPEKPKLRLPVTWTWRLILLCAVVWFLQMALRHWARTPIDTWFGLSLSGLARGQIWTVFTYAFLHADFGHLLWNGFGIWVFGGILERAMPREDFARLLVWGAIAGGVGYLIGDVIGGSVAGAYVIGASGILSALLALAALRYPRMPIRLLLFPFFPIPLWVIALLVFGGDILGALSEGTTNIAYCAHLGGAAYGLAVFRFGVVPRWSLPRVRIRGDGDSGPPRPTRADKKADAERRRVDELLDKINRDGIGALSDAERKFLNDASKRYR